MIEHARARRNLWGTLSIVAVLIVLPFFALHLAQASPLATNVSVKPATLDLTSSAIVTATIWVEDVESLYGLELDIWYDPSVVYVEQIEPGSFLSADFVVEHNVDNSAGHASLAYTQLANSPRTGSGDIAIVRLRKTDCLGQSSLNLTDVILSDQDGKAISHTLVAGRTDSGVAPTIRRLTGSLFHDSNNNGTWDQAEDALTAWPIYLQRFRIPQEETQTFRLTDQTGSFEFSNIACGRYNLWSRNGSATVLTQTVDLPGATDLQLSPLALVGSLQYPLKQLFLPVLSHK
ncbi:MAG: hypothetical protein KF753_19000 [Caldilineaceae bacterium]|nr:hypothetical protein [Caldilineaceae bacterium]